MHIEVRSFKSLINFSLTSDDSDGFLSFLNVANFIHAIVKRANEAALAKITFLVFLLLSIIKGLWVNGDCALKLAIDNVLAAQTPSKSCLPFPCQATVFVFIHQFQHIGLFWLFCFKFSKTLFKSNSELYSLFRIQIQMIFANCKILKWLGLRPTCTVAHDSNGWAGWITGRLQSTGSVSHLSCVLNLGRFVNIAAKHFLPCLKMQKPKGFLQAIQSFWPLWQIECSTIWKFPNMRIQRWSIWVPIWKFAKLSTKSSSITFSKESL